MKKFSGSLGFLLSLCLLSAGVLVLSSRFGGQDGTAEGEADKGSGKVRAAKLYSLEVEVLQTSASEEPLELLYLSGSFVQSREGEREEDEGKSNSSAVLTSWTRFDEARIMGRNAKDEVKVLLGQTVRSNFHPQSGELEHLLEPSSAQLETLQASLLEKIILPQEFLSSARMASSWEQRGRDEVGSYRARYHLKESKGGLELSKEWLQYSQAGVRVKAEANGYRYRYTQSGEIEGIEGNLGLSYASLVPLEYRTRLKVKVLSPADLVATPVWSASASGQKLRKFSLSANLQPPERKFSELMQELNRLDAASQSTEVYKVFSELKTVLKVEPHHAQALAERIRATSARDEGTKRQLALIFGALAESDSPETLRALSELLETCVDTYCRVQTLVGISDHRQADQGTADKVIELIKDGRFPAEASTALLALGSVGKNIGDDAAKISAFLLEQLEDGRKGELKTSILAAMGNHGDPRYATALSAALDSDDSRVRAAAVYSLRSQPGADVDARLIQFIKRENHKVVLLEAFKALAYRSLSGEGYQEIVRAAAQLEDEDLQLGAARALVHAAQSRVAGAAAAIEALEKQTRISQVQSYLAAEKAQLAAP